MNMSEVNLASFETVVVEECVWVVLNHEGITVAVYDDFVHAFEHAEESENTCQGYTVRRVWT